MCLCRGVCGGVCICRGCGGVCVCRGVCVCVCICLCKGVCVGVCVYVVFYVGVCVGVGVCRGLCGGGVHAGMCVCGRGVCIGVGMGVGRGVGVWWPWSDPGSPVRRTGCRGQAHVGMDMDEHPLRSSPKGGVAVAGEVDLVGGMRGGRLPPRHCHRWPRGPCPLHSWEAGLSCC